MGHWVNTADFIALWHLEDILLVNNYYHGQIISAAPNSSHRVGLTKLQWNWKIFHFVYLLLKKCSLLNDKLKCSKINSTSVELQMRRRLLPFIYAFWLLLSHFSFLLLPFHNKLFYLILEQICFFPLSSTLFTILHPLLRALISFH